MQKQEIISVLLGVRESHMIWVKQAQIIVDGINLDRLEEPLPYDEYDFSHWCKLHKKTISDCSLFEEIKEMHQKLHSAYSDIFYGSIRKYKPKTLNELTDCFAKLKSKSNTFKEVLDKTEADLYQMSDDAFESIMTKSENNQNVPIVETVANNTVDSSGNNDPIDFDTSNENINKNEAETTESIVIEDQTSNQLENTPIMQQIDINNYDTHQNPFDELESVIPVDAVVVNEAKIKITSTEDDVHTEVEITASLSESNNITPDVNPTLTAKRNISLKEQSIIQFKQEKELVTLELTHLEQTQKLTQQSADQLDDYYTLKQEEIILEQKDNGSFITFKNDTKKQIEDELTAIQENQLSLKNEINDLEKQNIKDKLEQEKNHKEVSIAKQFEELKFNKNKNLEELQNHKKSKEDDLVKLKQQVLLLEEEISDMGQDIDSKKHDLLDLEEKEKLKDEERSKKKQALEKIQQERNDSISNIQTELDQLFDEEHEKQNELNTIAFQIKELTKNSTILNDANSDELKELEQQQESKRKKLLETEELKSSKQQAIKDIEIRIVGLERSLEKIKTDQNQIEVVESELAITEQ